MQAGPIRVGLIGYGFSGKTFHAPLIRSVAGLSLDAVASSDPKKVQLDLPGVTVYEDPLALARAENIDVVVIATPNSSHASLARAALAAKKHVVIDKPFTLDLVEARDLITQSKSMGLVLSVFHNRRWDSDFLTVRQAIKQGMVGAAIHYESRLDRFRPEVRDRWREDGGPGSGVWSSGMLTCRKSSCFRACVPARPAGARTPTHSLSSIGAENNASSRRRAATSACIMPASSKP